MGRRGKDDEQWQGVKALVKNRDKNLCQCCKILTPGEWYIRNKNNYNKGMLNQLDCAHIEPVSVHPDLTYDPDNIVLLCRLCHSSIDNFINPITFEPMNKEEHAEFWKRIISSSKVSQRERDF